MTKLYVKASDRNLQYFGKTINNPHKYKGSGIHWSNHLKKHQPTVSTMIIGEYEDNDPMLTEHALGFSAANDIVLSDDWANMIPEHGQDGFDPASVSESNRNRVWSKLSLAKISKSSKGRGTYKDKDGNHFKASTKHPKVLSGEWVGIAKGTKLAPAKPERCRKISEAAKDRQTTGGKNPNAKSISINGKRYSCMKDALVGLPFKSYGPIRKRLKSTKYPNYQYT